jgi:hypothetical protein
MPINVSKSLKLQSLPFHPFLVVFFQILTIYAVNVNTANIIAVMFVLLMAVFFTALFFLLFSITTKDIKRAAIVVTFYCFLFFTYGRLCDIFLGLPITKLVMGMNRYLLPLYALFIIAGTLWIFRSQWCKKNLEGITYFFNVFGLGLVLVAVLIAITNFDWITFGSKRHQESKAYRIKKEERQVSQNRKNNIPQPNVYYIILDSYSSHSVLKKYYDWDDSGVVDALRARGFSVNKNAYSNYSFTNLSLPATLNMRYIHEDRGFIDANSKSGYLTQIMKQNEVMERFKSEGYAVVSNIGGNRLSNNKHSLSNGKKSFLSDDFVALVIHVSILRIMEDELNADALRQNILPILKDLKLFEIPNKSTFIFAYILCPHEPYVFDADGSKPKLVERLLERRDSKGYMKKYYIEQVRFIGTQIIEIVDSLRRRDPSAVIIVQADHGWGYIIGNYLSDHKNPPLEFIDAQLGILSAIYLPPGIVMPENITPINLFRYMFNTLFDANLEVLPDRAFFRTNKEPYAFYEVTNDLKHLMAE